MASEVFSKRQAKKIIRSQLRELGQPNIRSYFFGRRDAYQKVRQEIDRPALGTAGSTRRTASLLVPKFVGFFDRHKLYHKGSLLLETAIAETSAISALMTSTLTSPVSTAPHAPSLWRPIGHEKTIDLWRAVVTLTPGPRRR